MKGPFLCNVSRLVGFKSKEMRRSHIHVRPGRHCGTGLLGRCLNVGLKGGLEGGLQTV